jgi:PhnB protein
MAGASEQRAIPMLSYEDAGRAADWISEAFGFEQRDRFEDPGGTVTHVTLVRDGAVVFVGYPSSEYRGPKRHAEECEAARRWRQSPYVVDGVLVFVDDVDAHYARARAAGAAILSELEDNEAAAQRQYRAEDVEGHRWMFAQPT